MMMKLNDVTENTKLTNFCDLEIGDYFKQSSAVIWMKTDEFTLTDEDRIRNAIQITNNEHYYRYGIFKNDSKVEKIEIASINYRRV